MQREQIDFSGRLNKDDALPRKGDYTDAKNIIKTTSVNGGGNSVKKIPSITALNALGDAGSYVLASTVDEEGRIFYIKRVSATVAKIEMILGSGSPTVLISYEHGSPTIDPDIVVLGNVVVWNYYKEGDFDGVVLSWEINRTPVDVGAAFTSANIHQIHFAKPIPMTWSVTANVPSVDDDAQNEFRDKKWDFCCQYVYDSGEVSALSDFKTIFPEEDKSSTHSGLVGIGSVTLNVTETPPDYATQIIYFGRVNDGAWRRITTVGKGSPSVTFKGILNEGLATDVTSKPFDAVPVTAKTIEVIKNRVFLGNNQDDLGGGASGATIIANPDSTLEDSGAAGGDLDNPLSYFKVASGTNVVSEGVVDPVDSSTLIRERLANDSTYYIGFQFHNAQGKTRGVEAYTEFTTGMFTFPTRVESIDISIPTANIPSWAKYFQVVISNNRSKDFFIESYGTGKGYEIFNADGSTRIANFAAAADNVDSLVISTLVKYTFQQGDIININLSPLSSTPEYKTLRVKGYADGLLYIDPPEDLFEDFFMSSEYLHFEIFSPAQIGEDAIFRGTGDIRPISELVDAAGTSSVSIPSTSGETIAGPTGLNDCFLMKQKISPKTNIAETQWTSLVWREEGTNHPTKDIQIISDGTTTDLGSQNSFDTAELNEDRAPIDLATSQGLKLNPPTIYSGSTEEEIEAYEYSGLVTSTTPYNITADVAIAGLTLTPAISGFFDVSWNFDIKEDFSVWTAGFIEIEIRVGTSVGGVGTETVSTIRVNSGNGTTTVSGEKSINIPSGESIFFVIVDDGNSNSLSVLYSGTSKATASVESLSSDINRAGDYLLHARLNLASIVVDEATNLSVKIAVDGTPTYVIVDAQPLLAEKRSYDAIFTHAAVGQEKITLEVTLSGSLGTSSFRIANGTSLSAVLKEDRELYNTSVEETGEPLYYLARRNSKVDSVVNWYKPAGKPSLLYEDKPIQIQSNKFRWGDKYISGSKLNTISSFYFADQDEVGVEAGPITALRRTTNMKEEGTVLLAICERETYSIYVDESFLRDSGGGAQLIASDDVIGSIQTLKGNFGSSHKRSITSFASRVVFWDNRRKEWVRRSTEGLVPLGDTYKMKKVFREKDGDAVSFYDPFHDAFFLGFSGDSTMYVFQDREGFVSELEVDLTTIAEVQGGVVVDNDAIVFKGNSSYKTSGTGFLSYFGDAATEAYIQLPLVSPTEIEPLGISIKCRKWPDLTFVQSNFIKAGVFNVIVSNENGQETTIPSAYFRMSGGMVYSDVYKDTNSGTVITGQDLQGSFHEIKLELLDNTIDDQVEYMLVDYQILLGR